MYDAPLWLVIAGFGVFCLAMMGVCLVFGPKRGNWNQPAARLRRPEQKVVWSLYGFAAGQMLLGVMAAFASHGRYAFSALLISSVMALFYIGFAKVMAIASHMKRFDHADEREGAAA